MYTETLFDCHHCCCPLRRVQSYNRISLTLQENIIDSLVIGKLALLTLTFIHYCYMQEGSDQVILFVFNVLVSSPAGPYHNHI